SGRRQRLPLRDSIGRRRGRHQFARPRRVPYHLSAIRQGAANRPANLAEGREQVAQEITDPIPPAPPQKTYRRLDNLRHTTRRNFTVPWRRERQGGLLRKTNHEEMDSRR